jgi:hypothetical protein
MNPLRRNAVFVRDYIKTHPQEAYAAIISGGIIALTRVILLPAPAVFVLAVIDIIKAVRD